MSSDLYWRDTYSTFGPLFYELLGYYESNYNREPTWIDYAKVNASSEVLPIYGESPLPKYVMYLSQLPLVNRLTEIRQLAYTHVLFPGATHTRYEHSRGVMHRCSRILKKLAEKIESDCKDKGISITDDDRIVLEIAALLHDLGHPAWGHALDGITGFVVQLLGETLKYLFAPRKLDIAITLYLLLENDQMLKALEFCSKEIKDAKTREMFGKIVAQIVMEEEQPLFPEMKDNETQVAKTHLLTTILGTYRGRGGIDADRLDWLVRDAHHANLGAKLDAATLQKYDAYMELNKTDNFKVGIEDCEFAFVDDPKFKDTMTELREKIYSEIYEGIERSFSDSLLMRLAYSATHVINTVGNSFASSSITARTIMGYLLMYDNLMKEFTSDILQLSKQHGQLLGLPDPSARFTSKSYDLFRLSEDIKYIMHSLSPKTIKEEYLESMNLHFNYVELEQIGKKLIITTAEAFSNLIERAFNASKATDACKLAILFQNILAASRINAIGAMKVYTLESTLQDRCKDANICLLVNYYFFRKFDDCFKEVHDLVSLKEVLQKNLKSTPIFFIITNKMDSSKTKEIFEELCGNILANFLAHFQSIETIK